MLPINLNGILDSLRSPVESIFETVGAARPDIAGLFEPGAEVSLNPQPLPPIGEDDDEFGFDEMFEVAEMDFGQAGDEVSLNPQPLPPIGEIEQEFRIPEQFAAGNDGMLGLGVRNFDPLVQDGAAKLPEFDVGPLQLDLSTQPAFDMSALHSTMMIQ